MEWIDNIIVGLLDTYETNNPYELCNYLGIKIIKLEPENALLRKKDAFYYRDLEDKEVIFIKNNLNELTERFIIAHELGHALCNPDLLRASFVLSNKGKLEKQANYFAFNLLNIFLDKSNLKDLTLKQISSYTYTPYTVLMQLFYD